ncbi:hypothetical protein A8W25_06245 [Streptomyces sp. ERV7]|uniref:hypothetical protein n=1 Tax=Streptomyces sp. ERV7 TaxID=1322334 RepID=UPI0007F450C0|nr:hypothetical protein [Streptomyces sp. ERV7]OAR25246.1 hypothetical protein A8W25_06245 [Streptomyces sp. ERV7]
MVDTVNSLAARHHEVVVELLTKGPAVAGTRGLHDVVARAAALGPDGAWLAAAGHAGLGGLACVQGQVDVAILHLEAAVSGGFNDCVSLHIAPIRPLHHDPRFQALYRRMRITQADLDEFFWLHQEIQIMSREAQNATVDNIGRLDTGVSLLPQAPMPTREPNTPGVLITRIDLAATQTALQQAAVKAEFQRSSGNTSLSLIDDSWDYDRARRDAWHADDLDTHRLQAAAARAFVERPGVDTRIIPCPPLGSITYPG